MLSNSHLQAFNFLPTTQARPHLSHRPAITGLSVGRISDVATISTVHILDPEHNEFDARSVALSSAISLSSLGASHAAQDSEASPHKNFLLKFTPKGSWKVEIRNEGGRGISSNVREIAAEVRDGKGQGPFACSVSSKKQTEASVSQWRTSSPASQREQIFSPQTSQATFWWMENDHHDENMYGRYYHGSRWIDSNGSGNGGSGSEGGSTGFRRDQRGKMAGKGHKRWEGEEALGRLERVIQAGAVEREVGGGVVSGEIGRRSTLRREKKRKEKAIMKEVLNERRLTEERLREVFKQERPRVPDVPPSWKGREKIKMPLTPTRGPRGYGHGHAHGRGQRGMETAVRVVPSLVTVQKGGHLIRDPPISRIATEPERQEKQKSEPAAISHPRVSIGSVRSQKSQRPQMLTIDTTLDSPIQELTRARQRPLRTRKMTVARLPVGLGLHSGDSPKVIVPQIGTPSKENRRTSSLFATSFAALNLPRHLSIRNSKPPSSHLNSTHPRPVTIVAEEHRVAGVRNHLYFDNNVPPPMMQREKGPKEGLVTPLTSPMKSVGKGSVQSTPRKQIGRSAELGTSLRMMWDTVIVAPARTLSTRRPGNATVHLNNQPSEQVTNPSPVKKSRSSGVNWSLRNRHRQQPQTRTQFAPDVAWHAASSAGRGVGGRSPGLVKDGVGLPEVVRVGKMEMKVQDREGQFYVVSERMGLRGRDVVFVMERPGGSVSEGDLLASKQLSLEKGKGRKSMGGSWRGQNREKGREIVVEEGERKRVMSVGGAMRGDRNEGKTLGRSHSARVVARLKRWMGRRMEDVPEEGNGTGPPWI